MDPFPFFVGRGRSGTTLLRAIFDSHPEMAVPDETHFILGLSHRRRRYETGGQFAVEAFLSDLGARRGFRAMGVPVGTLGDELVTATDYPDAVRRVFRLYARERGKTRYGDKTPVQVLSLGPLARLFPEGRFVHIIRDGREVALSYFDLDWGPDTPEEAAILWKRAVRAGRKAGRSLGAERYREVRYEELVAYPEDTVRDLCRFLHLDFDPAMLRYHERAHEVAGPMGRPEARQSLYLPPTRGIRDWRQMRSTDLARFEGVAGDVLTELGYARGTNARGMRAQVRWRWIGWQASRGVDRIVREVGRAHHRLGSG